MSRTLEILDRLIGFPTVSADSNLELINYVKSMLTDLGFAVHQIPDASGQKAGLFAAIGPAGPGVMLSAHSDVVPVAGQDWTRDPFRMTVDQGRAYGRGTTDMKGYLASILSLAERAAVSPLHEPLKIALSYDEEIGCVGIRDMISQLESAIGLPRVCFVGEPTSMKVAVGQKGKAAFRATCHGINGHSAMAPNFLNALHLATDFIQKLRCLQEDLAQNGNQDGAYDIPYSTIHVGKMSGGMALNIVPDKAEIDFEFRHLASDHAETLLARIRDAADKATALHSQRFPAARIEIDQRNAYPGLDTDKQAAVVKFATHLANTTELTKVAFGTEAGYFDGLGIPTIVCGPGSMAGQGHKPDEYIALCELGKCDVMFDRLLAEMTG